MVDKFNNIRQILQGFKQAPVFEINPGSLQMELERASIKKKLKAIEDSKKIAMRNRIENATAKGLLPEGAEEFLRKEFRKQFSSIDDLIKNAPQEAKRLTSGYREMLRRTAPIQEVKQVDANKIASLIENAQQGANKNIVIKGTNVLGQQIKQPQTINEAVNILKSNLPKAKGALMPAVPYIPIAGSIYDIVAGGKKVLSPTKEGDLGSGLGQAGLGALGLIPSMQWAKYAKAGKLARLPMASKIKAIGFPTAGALVGSNNNQFKVNTQPAPLDNITEEADKYAVSNNGMSGMQYTVLPDPPNSNAIANDMSQVIGTIQSRRPSSGYQQTQLQQQYAPVPMQDQPVQQNKYDYSIAQALLDMYNKEQGRAIKQNEINRLIYQLDQIGSRQQDRFDREYYANIAKARDNQNLAGIPSAIGSEQDLATGRYQNRLQSTQDRINKLNAVNQLAGNLAVAKELGVDPAVAMADKDIQKVLTAYNQIGGRETVANINAMARMYGADRDVDIANIKAMAQALSTDARLSAQERMYYANLANKLDIAKMNATVAPYRFGYDITPEYVDLINSGANIQTPIVPSTNVLGGMMGNQGFTNQLDFNRINRGN